MSYPPVFDPQAFVLAVLVALSARALITRCIPPEQPPEHPPEGSPVTKAKTPATFDLDAIVEQRREAVGGDDIVFTFKGETFSFPHPLLAPDEWKEEVAEAGVGDVDQVRAMLGEDQYDRFHALGGQAGFVMLIVQQVQQSLRDEMADGRPTRPSTSSRRRPRR
ncbi:hypothetical protein [Pseudonocardia sp. D17]|uniref:hypothetical protein n=1 Tax=Pseudonocardia sp. D17 TaxID=882661 RepID=UPI002B3DFFEC|nr:hypothetical protein PSD17_39160 [Pseudonocardia sp. D17]